MVSGSTLPSTAARLRRFLTLDLRVRAEGFAPCRECLEPENAGCARPAAIAEPSDASATLPPATEVVISRLVSALRGRGKRRVPGESRIHALP
jgi:hypothetical protein